MGSERLSRTARSLIEDEDNEWLLSTASLWEMAIKLSLGKLILAQPFDVLIPDQLRLNGIGVLNIEWSHISAVAKLAFHHRDPFDRLIVAQSMVEGMPIISADDAYGVSRKW